MYATVSTEKPVVFAKHIGKFLVNLDKKLLFNCDSLHIILIRDPLAMIMSWENSKDVHQEESSLEGTCLPQLAQVYSDVRRLGGCDAIIVDVDLLQNNPEPILRELCRRLGIDFLPEQLEWPAGPKPIDGIWAPYWYSEVHKSTGFLEKEDKGARKPISQLTKSQVHVSAAI
jgi:hypothetical protein